MAPTPRTAIVQKSSSAKETAKKVDDADEVPAYSQENVQINMRIIYYSRTFLSIVGGVIAGVLGLTGISGFLCYFLIMMLASGGIAAKAKFDVHSYFDSWNRVLFDGIGQGMLVSFVILSCHLWYVSFCIISLLCRNVVM
ncbi:hypothetical protein M758_12G164600 [Ceratodon purpureus]|uniref:ER membrane protein complex subunit 6 n=1 Tax=Ceratodon purpureus TaxID=3225 RepID=A0A8T0G8G2_CERPU|nr:hypothetical protein KC19_12G162300 [Ceratodon purpureus]KAG0599598.1 hypothetical protein M758_12G164600 [Ceratodon purpureus]